MLTPSENTSTPAPSPLRQTSLGAAVMIGVVILGALVLYLVTRGLLLVLPEMRPWSIEEMIE